MRAALESIVLLKNENNILPLSKDLKKVAVIGPNANEVQNLICRYGPANAPIKTVYQGIKELSLILIFKVVTSIRNRC